MEYKYLRGQSLDGEQDKLMETVNLLAKQGWRVCRMQCYHAGFMETVYILMERSLPRGV